mmetsp:Transcript_17979/g.8415  ORF Transcript_17979/g.8415 Transcript_17979/m.8415 type:complete len:87 (-) Transcript_17979:123-383(-)
MFCNEQYCVNGHNEDQTPQFVDRNVMVKAKLGSLEFTTYLYAGRLPTSAFGFNNHGIAYTINWVAPKTFVSGGLGRTFISRNLLEA